MMMFTLARSTPIQLDVPGNVPFAVVGIVLLVAVVRARRVWRGSE